MLSYKDRKSVEALARKIPSPIREAAIDILNPLRISSVERRKSLRWVTLFITNYCNARCNHCFYWNELNSKLPELSLDQLSASFESLKGQINTIRLSGGEPFLRKDLVDFYKFIDGRRIAKKLSIPTHGMMKTLVPEVERMVKGSRFAHLNVSVSLDGLEATHNASRKIRNGFSMAVENLKQMVALEHKHERFNVSVGISLMRGIALPKDGEKESEAVRLIKFLRDEAGVRTIGYDHIRSSATDVFLLPPEINSGFAPPPTTDEDPDNRHKRSGDVQLDIDEMEWVNADLARFQDGDAGRLTMRRLETQVQIKKTKQRIVDCLAGYLDCVIYPSGDVAVCEFTTPFANLHDFDFDLEALMHSEAADKARSMTRACACTHPCHLSASLAYDSDFLKFYLSDHS